MIGQTIIGSGLIGGGVGAIYGHIQHYGRDRSHISPIQTTATGMAVGGAIGLAAMGVTLKTGKMTSPFSNNVVRANGTTFSGNTAQFMRNMGIK